MSRVKQPPSFSAFNFLCRIQHLKICRKICFRHEKQTFEKNIKPKQQSDYRMISPCSFLSLYSRSISSLCAFAIFHVIPSVSCDRFFLKGGGKYTVRNFVAIIIKILSKLEIISNIQNPISGEFCRSVIYFNIINAR